MPTRRRIWTGLGVFVDVDFADAHGASGAGDGIGFVHAVDAAHEGAFAAAGGADEGRGVVGRNVQVDVLQRVIGAVPRVQVDDLDANAHLASPFQDAAAGDEANQRDGEHNQNNQNERTRPCETMPVVVG